MRVLGEGSGKFELTGSLGAVMKESARLAITYARVVSEKFGYPDTDLTKVDIHVHAPEGAIPKDGPSAGVTLTSALVSALSGYPVSSEFAMTGEITLHGVVLAIGGLKEKTMAAHKEGIRKIILPKSNMPDLHFIDDSIKEEMTFYPVEMLSEVLSLVLIKPKQPAKKDAKQAPVAQQKAKEKTARPTIHQ